MQWRAPLETTHPTLERVTIIMVTYNSAHCLPAQQQLLGSCPHITVVDNASLDNSIEQAQRSFPWAKVKTMQSNLGFGAANNLALREAQTEYALLLNPDCEINSENIIRLVDTADRYPDAAIVAPQLLTADRRSEINYRWPQLLWRSRGPGASAPTCVGFVCGAAMLLRLSAFNGGVFFDERFYLYYEDDDLCLRLWQQKKSLIIDPNCIAVHRSRGSVRGPKPWRSEYWRGYHHAQSKLTFTRLHCNPKEAQTQRRNLIAGTILSLPLRIIFMSPRLVARMFGRLNGAINWKHHG